MAKVASGANERRNSSMKSNKSHQTGQREKHGDDRDGELADI